MCCMWVSCARGSGFHLLVVCINFRAELHSLPNAKGFLEHPSAPCMEYIRCLHQRVESRLHLQQAWAAEQRAGAGLPCRCGGAHAARVGPGAGQAAAAAGRAAGSAREAPRAARAGGGAPDQAAAPGGGRHGGRDLQVRLLFPQLLQISAPLLTQATRGAPSSCAWCRVCASPERWQEGFRALPVLCTRSTQSSGGIPSQFCSCMPCVLVSLPHMCLHESMKLGHLDGSGSCFFLGSHS